MNKENLNPLFQDLKIDYLYHLGIDTSMDLHSVFDDITHVIYTLTNADAQVIANEFARHIYKIHNEEFNYTPIYKTERFHMYKVGTCIVISTGVGMQSLLIALNEVTKLMVHLGKYEVVFLKIGLCGGVGVEDGSIIISNTILNGKFETLANSVECGKIYHYPTIFDDTIARELVEFSKDLGNVCLGINLSTNNFNDAQARMSGAIPPAYTEQEAHNYLISAYNAGVRSIDMESLTFAAFCNQLEIEGCVIGISIVNRLQTEKVVLNMDMQTRLIAQYAQILIRYIQSKNNKE